MPLPSTFAAASARAEGEFTKISTGPAPIGGPYWILTSEWGSHASDGGSGVIDDGLKIAFDFTGNIFQASNDGNYLTIRKFNTSNTLLWQTQFGINAGDAAGPRDMIFGSDGYLYILVHDDSEFLNANTALSIYILKLNPTNGSIIFQIGASGNNNSGGVDSGSSMCMDSSNNIYVYASQTSTIWKISSSGVQLAQVALNNNNYTWTSSFTGNAITIYNNYLYIWAVSLERTGSPTSWKPRIIKLDLNLNFVSAATLFTQFAGNDVTKNIAIAPDGTICLTGLGNNTLFTAKFLASWPTPASNGNILGPGATGATGAGLGNYGCWLNTYNWSSGGTTGAQLMSPGCLTVSSDSTRMLIGGDRRTARAGTFILEVNLTDYAGNFSKTGAINGGTHGSSYNPYTRLGDVKYDTSGNVYWTGTVSSSSGTSYTAGKNTGYANFEDSFLIKDINNWGTTHAINTTLNNCPITLSTVDGSQFYYNSANWTGSNNSIWKWQSATFDTATASVSGAFVSTTNVQVTPYTGVPGVTVYNFTATI